MFEYNKMILLVLLYCLGAVAKQWPYDRYVGSLHPKGFRANKSEPEFQSGEHPHNHFNHWLRGAVDRDPKLQKVFVNGSLPRGIRSFGELEHYIDIPASSIHERDPLYTPMPSTMPVSARHEAANLLKNLPYALDTRCTSDKSRWWYRTYDGSCNWLEANQISDGQVGTAKIRDYNRTAYADGVSAPREGPNPRAVSNAFFRRKKSIYYEHTPMLLGLIEFIIHDISYSQDSTTDYVDVPMPPDEDTFPLDTTLKVWRTAALPGTGTSKKNPRQNVNMASTWLDVSALYGSSAEVAHALRSFSGGKLLTQELQTRGSTRKASYLPFNTMNVPIRTRPGRDPKTLFAGGDARTNEDWVMLAVHTLLLREHNRLCDILARQHPEYNDEQIYQTIRLVMSAKFALIANSYQMAYWTDKMPWPRDDGFPLYRQMLGKSVEEVNPANSYPWPLVTKGGKPMVVSAEMAIVYRFHDFIIPSFPIKDAINNTIWEQDLFGTGFNATGFIDAGLENILRGMTATHIPNFKSGVDEAFRSARGYRGNSFDIVTASIVHEREQGIPTFNAYFRDYNQQDPQVVVPIRQRFEDFSSDPEVVANLKRLYSRPDEVDLTVGVQLEEEMFPGTTVPKSALVISLFSLFGMGNSDRFSVGYAIMRCFLVDSPLDCHPSNALEELLWASKPREGFPNFRFLDSFWMTELDFQAHGTNLLWRLVHENTDVKCLQRRPLFPADPDTNPILCDLPKPGRGSTFGVASVSGIEVGHAWVKGHSMEVATVVACLLTALIAYRGTKYKYAGLPHLDHGWPLLGEGLAFQKDPKALLIKDFQRYYSEISTVFGFKLANMDYYVMSTPADIDIMLKDNPFEVKFNLHDFFALIGFPLIQGKQNFESDLHTKLVRSHLKDRGTLDALCKTVDDASRTFLLQNALAPFDGQPKEYSSLSDYLTRYVTFVISRCLVGPDSFDNPILLETFMKFNDDAIQAMALSSFLPAKLKWLAQRKIKKHYKTVRNILMPVISRRRHAKNQKATSNGIANGRISNGVTMNGNAMNRHISSGNTASGIVQNCPIFSESQGLHDADFLGFIIDAVDDDQRVSDILVIIVWAALTNLQYTLESTFLDIINDPDLQSKIISSLSSATIDNLDPLEPTKEWRFLRSVMFESLRLGSPITGPARVVSEPTKLASNPKLHLPKGQVATLTSYHTHRQRWAWGDDATEFKPDRFAHKDPPVGQSNYLIWGLEGPHTCPGRWLSQNMIQVMIKELLDSYEFDQEEQLSEDAKFVYHAGSVGRKEIRVKVRRRPDASVKD